MTGRLLRLGMLAAAFALATAGFGWRAIPILALTWGCLSPRRAGSRAAASAALAWACLLLAQAPGGGLVRLAPLLAETMRVPLPVPPLLTLVVPAVLAWAAATLGAEVRRRWWAPAGADVGEPAGRQH